MKKPDMHLSGAFFYGPALLSADELSALLDLVPRSWKATSAQNRLAITDADRLILGVREAIGYFDASSASVSGPISAVREDLSAISGAAIRLQKAIQAADDGARRAIDAEAIGAIGFDGEVSTLSQAGEFAVHWFEALRRRGHLELALKTEEAREFERRTHSILSALWDLSGDVAGLATRAMDGLPDGGNARPDRVLAQGLAKSIVEHVQRALHRSPPASSWFEELVTLAGSYRGVIIGKGLTRKAIRGNATRPPGRPG